MAGGGIKPADHDFNGERNRQKDRKTDRKRRHGQRKQREERRHSDTQRQTGRGRDSTSDGTRADLVSRVQYTAAVTVSQ